MTIDMYIQRRNEPSPVNRQTKLHHAQHSIQQERFTQQLSGDQHPNQIRSVIKFNIA